MDHYTELLQSALEAMRGYRQEHGDCQPCDTEKAIEAVLAEQSVMNATQTKRSVISAEQLEGMFHKLEKLDQNSWGYKWKEGWNAALRQAMDYAMPQAAEPVGEQVIVGRAELAMIRNALQRDADEGKQSRKEMLWALDESARPAPTQQPLTDEQIDMMTSHIYYRGKPVDRDYRIRFFRQAEAAHNMTGSKT